MPALLTPSSQPVIETTEDHEHDGLVAIGGDLDAQTLIQAYSNGVFPWYSDQQPVLWWSPDPRAILFPENLNISRSLRKSLKNQHWKITVNEAFPAVIKSCSNTDERKNNTWITAEMIIAYNDLHDRGFAHSVEVWLDGKLVGGLYGIALGQVFFGESMFSSISNSSKIAFVYLVRSLAKMGFKMIDCQVESAHLNSLGAHTIPKQAFLSYLKEYIPNEPKPRIVFELATLDTT